MRNLVDDRNPFIIAEQLRRPFITERSQREPSLGAMIAKRVSQSIRQNSDAREQTQASRPRKQTGNRQAEVVATSAGELFARARPASGPSILMIGDLVPAQVQDEVDERKDEQPQRQHGHNVKQHAQRQHDVRLIPCQQTNRTESPKQS